MKLQAKQRGLGMVSWLLILLIAGFFLMCFFRMGPAYMDNMYIKDALRSLAENNPNLREMDKSEINSALQRYTTMNNVRGDEANSFKIRRTKEGVLVTSVYEVRVPIVANVDVVMSFESQLDSANPDKCCEYLIKEQDEKK